MENNKDLEKKSSREIEKDKKNKKVWLLLGIIGIILIGIILYVVISEQQCINNGSNTSLPDDSLIVYKPIIYLYPKEQMELCVTLGAADNITCSYPIYQNGWNVIANPDGSLKDMKTGRNLYALYWEGIYTAKSNLESGFVVKGTDTITFLEEKLAMLGLSDKEAEEFIIYWLPKLQENEYNYIRFATMDEINESMPMEFSIKPDTLIRVWMEFKALDKEIKIPEQLIETPKREGFVVVEWGGTEIKN